MSFPRLQLSNQQTLKLILDGVEIAVLLSDFAQQLSCKNAGVPDIYFISTDADIIAPILFLNQNAKQKSEEVASFLKFEHQKLQILYSLKKEINKKLFSEADLLVDKNLSCPRIKLSNSQTLLLDGVETGIFLLDFAQQLRHKNADVPDIYFSLLDAAGTSPTLIQIQDAKLKREEAGCLFKIWSSEAAKVVHRVVLPKGSVRNLKKASILPVSKIFYIKNPRTEKLLLLRVKSREWRRLRDSKKKLGVWT